MFLHGDLHHENILLGPSKWVVIDPKGLVGDPAFELSAFVRNPLEELRRRPNLGDFLCARITMLAKVTGYNPWRIWGWSLLALGISPDDEETDPIELALKSLNQRFA